MALEVVNNSEEVFFRLIKQFMKVTTLRYFHLRETEYAHRNTTKEVSNSNSVFNVICIVEKCPKKL